MKKMSANAMIAANGGKKTSATCDLCKKKYTSSVGQWWANLQLRWHLHNEHNLLDDMLNY